MGAPLAGRVLIIDDVMTAGTAVREVVGLLHHAGATVAGVVLGLDRGERGSAEESALRELAREIDAPVASIIHLDDIVDYLEGDDAYRELLPRMRAYRSQWGATGR